MIKEQPLLPPKRCVPSQRVETASEGLERIHLRLRASRPPESSFAATATPKSVEPSGQLRRCTRRIAALLSAASPRISIVSLASPYALPLI